MANGTTTLAETRPGYKTTEFVLTLIVAAVGLIEVIADPFGIPDKYVVLANAISVAAYTISRGQAKQGVPNA